MMKRLHRILSVALIFGLTASALARQKRPASVHKVYHKVHRSGHQKVPEVAPEPQFDPSEILGMVERERSFLEKHRTKVQVTAFAKQRHSNKFANGRNIHSAYAVKRHELPADVIVNVALSRTAQRKLNAKMDDLLVLMDEKGEQKTLARVVDTTNSRIRRSVVDVYFSKASTARKFGRKVDFYAVNITAENSPFSLF
jgi:3D (Asp-Asp-Asp) domain-containing protein